MTDRQRTPTIRRRSTWRRGDVLVTVEAVRDGLVYYRPVGDEMRRIRIDAFVSWYRETDRQVPDGTGREAIV